MSENLGGEGVMTVYFFDKPVIGYCPECDEIAVYHPEKGLIRPRCGTTNLSIFVWDGESRYPEDAGE